MFEAPASLALKVSARNVVGKAGGLCQKVCVGAEEVHALGEGVGGTQPPPSPLPGLSLWVLILNPLFPQVLFPTCYTK